jgi:hypothetical protein
MLLKNITFGLLAAATCLVPMIPAHAGPGHGGPISQYGGSILDPHSSTLSKDPTLLCSDVVGNNTSKSHRARQNESSSQTNSANAWDRGSNNSNNSQSNTKVGGSFAGFGASVDTSKANSSSNSKYDKGSNSYGSARNNRSASESSSETSTAVRVGKNCDALVTAAATRDVGLAGAEAQIRSTEIASEAKLKAIKAEADAKFYENLLKW